MKPRVLIVTKGFWPRIGGVEKTAHELTQAVASEFDVTVLTVSDQRSSTTERCGNFTVVRVAKLASIFSTPISLTFPSVFQHLARCADIIHLHSPHPVGELSLMLSGFQAKVANTYHFDFVRQKIFAPIYRPLLHRTLDRTNVIVCSNPNIRRTSPILQLHADKVKIIPFGIDSAKFQLKGAEFEEVRTIRNQYSRPLVLFVGRLVYYKGIECLIRAASEVDINLIIIGNGPLEGKLRKLAYTLRIESRTHFLPHLPRRELKLYFHTCDLFVLPSVARSEAFGLVLLEAMACGKPLITTELGTGTSWVNQHGRTGLVVSPRDAPALAEAIRRLISEPDLARQFGHAAKIRVQEIFSYSRFAEGYLRIYRQLLGMKS